MPYDIVRYRPEFKAQILALQSHLWGPDLEANEAYFRWKYEQNPYAGEPSIYLVLSEGRVVAMRGFYGAQWNFDDMKESLVYLSAGDLVVAPEHRNRGLFSRLMEFAQKDLASQGVNYLFNLSGSPVTQMLSLAAGWRSIGLLPRFDWASPSLGWLARVFKTERERRAMRDLFDDRGRKSRRWLRLERMGFTAHPQPEAMAKLAQQLAGDGRLRHDRSQRFFEWRFRNPRSTYRFVYHGGQRLEGYLVLQVPRQGETTQVNVVDWCAIGGSVLKDLIRRVIDVGQLPRFAIRSSGFPPEMQNILAELDFRPAQYKPGVRAYKPTVLVKPLGEERLNGEWTLAGRPLLDIATWDVRMIDSDGF